MHTWTGTVSRRVLTIRTKGWEAVTRGGGCDSMHHVDSTSTYDHIDSIERVVVRLEGRIQQEVYWYQG
jgi:hypothetical protein